jgi:restriction system protein
MSPKGEANDRERLDLTVVLATASARAGVTAVAYRTVDLPAITLKALIVSGERTSEGVLIEAVAVPWFEILDYFRRYPESIYEVDPRKWEEIIAGGYRREGYEVELTPRSGDKGRDVVAARRGVGSVRILDQVKAYRRGNLVTADKVRAMLGVITGAQNVSKGNRHNHIWFCSAPHG